MKRKILRHHCVQKHLKHGKCWGNVIVAILVWIICGWILPKFNLKCLSKRIKIVLKSLNVTLTLSLSLSLSNLVISLHMKIISDIHILLNILFSLHTLNHIHYVLATLHILCLFLSLSFTYDNTYYFIFFNVFW